MGEKAPAFQFYPKDFLSDGKVAEMTLTERGAYIMLICYCWQEQSLPNAPERLANMIGTPATMFAKLWPALKPCFRETEDGRLIHPRLQLEREKQEHYRQRQANAGRASAATRRQPDTNRGSTNGQPKTKSPISSLHTAVLLQDKKHLVVAEEQPPPAHARSKRPIFTGQRLTVFEWMRDECTKILGEFGEQFDLHEWFFELDKSCVDKGLVPPKRDSAAWLTAELVAEAQRRGIPLRLAKPAAMGKQTTRLMSAMANIMAEGKS